MKHSISARTVVSIIVPVVVVAIVVGGMAYAVTRDSGGADALTVNGQSVSQVTVNQEIKALTKLPNVTPTSPGAASSDISTGWLTSRVAAVALDQLFVDNHVVLTAAQRTKFVHQLRKQFPGLPQSSENVVIAVSLADSLLSDKLGGSDAVAAVLAKEMRKLDVSVDPKYGRWVRARAQVCPVTGCPAPSSSTSSGG